MRGLEERCYLEMLRGRYCKAGKKAKGDILSEVEERFQVCRRQARRLMEPRAVGRPKNSRRPGRRGKYQDAEFRQALREVWRAMRYMCGRLLKAGIPDWLEAIEAERGRPFPKDVHERLLAISASSIDRNLAPHKVLKGKSLTKPGSFRDQIPIQESIWNIQIPGFLEADTVAHCGGSTQGEYINSVVMVDIATIWSEARAVFGKGSTPIVNAIEDIEKSLPFSIKGYDSDNGTEVLNQHVLRYFRDERVERGKPEVQVTRSREYRKNDNAHVEQRNDSLARRWLGYERMDFAELQPLIDYYYKYIVCPLTNHFFPSFKLHDKIRIKSRTRRVYKNPITPYRRVMESPHVSEVEKFRLKAIHEQLNPVQLLKQERLVRKRMDSALKALKRGQAAAGLLAVPPPPLLATSIAGAVLPGCSQSASPKAAATAPQAVPSILSNGVAKFRISSAAYAAKSHRRRFGS